MYVFLNQFSPPNFFSNKKGEPPRHYIQTKKQLHSLIMPFTLFRVNRKLSFGMPEMNRCFSHPLFLYCLSLSACACVFYGFCIYFFLFRVYGGVSSCNQCIPNEGKGVFFLDNNPSHQSETRRRTQSENDARTFKSQIPLNCL